MMPVLVMLVIVMPVLVLLVTVLVLCCAALVSVCVGLLFPAATGDDGASFHCSCQRMPVTAVCHTEDVSATGDGGAFLVVFPGSLAVHTCVRVRHQ